MDRTLTPVRVRVRSEGFVGPRRGRLRWAFSRFSPIAEADVEVNGPWVETRLHLLGPPRDRHVFAGPLTLELPGREPWSLRPHPEHLRSDEEVLQLTLEVPPQVRPVRLLVRDAVGTPIPGFGLRIQASVPEDSPLGVYRPAVSLHKTDADGALDAILAPGSYQHPWGPFQVGAETELVLNLPVSRCHGTAVPSFGKVSLVDPSTDAVVDSLDQYGRATPFAKMRGGRWEHIGLRRPGSTLEARLIAPGTEAILASALVRCGGAPVDLRPESMPEVSPMTRLRLEAGGRPVERAVVLVSTVAGERLHLRERVRYAGQRDLSEFPPGHYYIEVHRTRRAPERHGPFRLGHSDQVIEIDLAE